MGRRPCQRRDHIRGTRAAADEARRSLGAPNLRAPSLKRAAIQGAVLAALYFILIRFIWKQEGGNAVTYVLFPLVGFVAYTAIAYWHRQVHVPEASAQAQGPVEVGVR